MSKVADELRAAMALIEDPARWCQGIYARGRSGRGADPRSRYAVRRCALGALIKVCASLDANNLLYEAAHGLDNKGIAHINDQLGHAAVLECYREAIRRAEAGAA